GAGDEMLEDFALAVGRLGQDGVRCEDHRRGEAIDEIAHKLAVGSAEDTVFVLQPDRLDAALVDPPRGREIGLAIVGDDRPGDARVLERRSGVVERVDVDFDVRVELGELLDNVAAERGNAAFARRVSADHRDPAWWQGILELREDRTDIGPGGAGGRASGDVDFEDHPVTSPYNAASAARALIRDG